MHMFILVVVTVSRLGTRQLLVPSRVEGTRRHESIVLGTCTLMQSLTYYRGLPASFTTAVFQGYVFLLIQGT
jgi:hypothetical protein